MGKEARGAITKTANAHLRRVVIEAAWHYQHRPHPSVVFVLVVIPTVRLLPRLLDPAVVPAVYALSLFAVLDRFRDVVSKSVLFKRSLLLLQTVAAVALLIWMLRPARLAALPAGTPIPRALGRTLSAALVVLALAAIANVAGWVHLSRALAEGVLTSAYAAAVIYGGVRVLHTALRAGLRSASAQQLGLVRRHGTDVNRWLRRAIHAGAFTAWGYFTRLGFVDAETSAGNHRHQSAPRTWFAARSCAGRRRSWRRIRPVLHAAGLIGGRGRRDPLAVRMQIVLVTLFKAMRGFIMFLAKSPSRNLLRRGCRLSRRQVRLQHLHGFFELRIAALQEVRRGCCRYARPAARRSSPCSWPTR